MKKLLVTLVAVLVSASAFAQGTIVFNNRNLSGAGGNSYHAPVTELAPGLTAGANAQLFLVEGGNLTPLTPLNTFRAQPNNAFLVGPVTVEVPGKPAGTAGLQFLVRAWSGSSFDSASVRGQSEVFTVAQALGGVPPGGGPPITPPDLGGGSDNGFKSFQVVPEPSTITLGVLGAAALLLRRRK